MTNGRSILVQSEKETTQMAQSVPPETRDGVLCSVPGDDPVAVCPVRQDAVGSPYSLTCLALGDAFMMCPYAW